MSQAPEAPETADQVTADAPEDATTSEGAEGVTESTPQVEDKVTKQREQLDELNGNIKQYDTALKQMERMEGGQKSQAFQMLSKQRDELKAKAATIEQSIERAEKQQALAKYTDPIIAAFGTVTVADAKALPTNLSIDDLEERKNAAQGWINKGQSLMTVIEALVAAVKTAGVPEDATEDLRPFQIIANGEKSVKIAVASRAGGRTGGGGRGGARGKLVKITKANDDHADLVGKTIGKNGDYATWRALVESLDKSMFDELEAKRATGSNWSASIVAGRKFGVESVEVEPVATA